VLKRIAAAAAAALLLAGIARIATMPPRVWPPRLVEVPDGATARQIAGILKREGVIRSEGWFLRVARWRGVDQRLEAGVYEFRDRSPTGAILEKLVRGQIAVVKLTVPEGATCADIAGMLARRKVEGAGRFEAYARERKLEGFLFPDTYVFPLGVSIETVAEKMLETFRVRFEDAYGETITRKNEKEVKKIVTVASIVEKEAEIDSERALIAGIFYNRLRRRMPLQSCSTVEYALGVHRKRLTKADLQVESPYNTYKHKGLPPGPICNPGRKSLRAAINPARTDYLFFLSRGDGSHQFSRTGGEHMRAFNQYIAGGTMVDTPAAE